MKALSDGGRVFSRTIRSSSRMTSYGGGAAASVLSITLAKMSLLKVYFHRQSKPPVSRWNVSIEEYATYSAILCRHRPQGTCNLRMTHEWKGVDQARDSNDSHWSQFRMTHGSVSNSRGNYQQRISPKRGFGAARRSSCPYSSGRDHGLWNTFKLQTTLIKERRLTKSKLQIPDVVSK